MTGGCGPSAAMAQHKGYCMIIDCHGHYTTAPQELTTFRDAQIAALKDPVQTPSRASLKISDDQIRDSLEGAQLKLQRERGTDVTIFSPRASTMAHHIGKEATSIEWSQICNDLIARVVDLYPKNFVGVCMLPQSPGVPPANSARELERCVKDLGFIGANLNPDPSGGHWTAPPLTDRHWYPLYEKLVELDVPAMVHVSSSCNANFHATGAHYINADTTAFMQFIQGDLFKDFPTLRLIIPARRRGGSVSLGTLSRSRAGHEAPAARHARDEERVLRHLRLSPAGHRPAAQGDSRREHPVRLGDGRRRARHRSHHRAVSTTTPSATSNRPRCRLPTRRASSKAMHSACFHV